MKRIIRIMSVLLVAAMLMTAFSACGVIKGDTVMEYDGYEITEAMYSYWKSHFKAAFIDAYGTSDSNGKKSINWDETLPDGSTYESFFENVLVDPYAKKVLVCLKLFDDYDLKLTDEAVSGVEDIIEGLKSIYGDKKGVNAYLSSYNLNLKTLERIYYAEAKVSIVTDYIFGAGGPHEITAGERVGYYTANYYCVNWIYIYTEKKPADTSEGTNADGSYIMVDMNETEKAQKRQLVNDIVSKLKSGEKTFAEMKTAYCEDKYEDGTSKYDYLPNGFNLSANDYADYGVELIRLIQGMQIGDITTYDDEYGGTRIIVRNPLTDYTELTEQEKNFMLDFESYVIEEKWENMLASAKIKTYEEVMKRYSVKTVIPFDNLVV